MIRDLCRKICLNKNVLMLITVGFYILALYSALSGIAFEFALCLTVIFIFVLIKDIFHPKYILIWIFVFYFGVINTNCRLKNTDTLLSISPLNATIWGKIVSIP